MLSILDATLSNINGNFLSFHCIFNFERGYKIMLSVELPPFLFYCFSFIFLVCNFIIYSISLFVNIFSDIFFILFILSVFLFCIIISNDNYV